jgi:hypothetical protein
MTHIKGSSYAALVYATLLSACGGSGSNESAPPSNRAPVVSSGSFEVDEDTTLVAQLSASDPEGQPVTFSKASEASHGTVTLSDSGAFTYSPHADFNGFDQFSVRIADASGVSASVGITISVRPVNDAPLARNDELRIDAGTAIAVLANDQDIDGDTLSVTILSQPRGGVVNVSNGNVVTFEPENAYEGPASFRYRVADAAGESSEATANVVVGAFPGIVFVSDDTVLGTRELHMYDGLRTVRVSAPLASGAVVDQFSIAKDAQHVAYVVKAASDQVFLADLRQPGIARPIYQSPGPSGFESTRVRLNRDGSFAFVVDQALTTPMRSVLVRTSDTTETLLGASNPEITAGGDAIFNPVTDEFYLQGQVGGTPPLAGSGFTTLYAASTTSPSPLARIGATYVAGGGNGSGILPAVTSDGQRVVHLSVIYGVPAPNVTPNLLVNDRASQSETNVFRAFAPYELAFPLAFDVSEDGERACFILTDQPSPRSSVWFSDLAAPGHGIELTAMTDYNFDCKWASDDRTLVYSSSDAGGAQELWSVDTLQPVPRRVREPFVSGERLYFSAVSTQSRIILLGISPPNSVTPDFYRASLDAPGSSIKFASGTFIVSGNVSKPKANATGTLIAYGKGDTPAPNPAVPRLRLMSTQTTDYDWLISRPDGVRGTGQFEFLPAR